MFHRLKQLIPTSWFRPYHWCLAYLSAAIYRHPSRQLIVIGVTGTNGKTTTSYLLAKALEASGHQTGCTTTAVLKIGQREWLNPTKMTMPGRFFLQRLLRQMVTAGCRYAVIETSSQGLMQSRHLGIAYDVAAFTNLTPEHIEAHGGFENYQQAKRRLFAYLASLPVKSLNGRIVPRAAVVNGDDLYADYYAATPGIARVVRVAMDGPAYMRATAIKLTETGSSFLLNGHEIKIALPGRYNVSNALVALGVCRALGVDVIAAAQNIAKVKLIPGRFERVEVGQAWQVIVDYAPEPASLARLYEAVALVPHRRIIHVFGKCGGGRDAASRPEVGRFIGQRADIAIVTNEDPYDDDPERIMREVAAGAEQAGKIKDKNLFVIPDRRQAIERAMRLAQAGDLVLLTGKGCEPWMCVAGGKKLPWNEVETARAAIRAALG